MSHECSLDDERATLVEALSWTEDSDIGRWGHGLAAVMLDDYVERVVATRLAALRLPRTPPASTPEEVQR